MTRRAPYRDPQTQPLPKAPLVPRERVVRVAEPPEDPDVQAERERREKAKTVAAGLAEMQRMRAEEEQTAGWLGVLGELLRHLVNRP